MDASLRWHDEEGRMDASLRPLLRIRALAALVRPEHRWHDEERTTVIPALAALVCPEHRWHDEERTTVIPA